MNFLYADSINNAVRPDENHTCFQSMISIMRSIQIVTVQ